MPIKRTIGLIVVMLLGLIAGTWMAVKLATDHLLYQNATSEARNWARYLTENVTDLEPIASGERPSSDSMAFFQLAKKVGLVFRYTIYNREGYSQLVSDHERVAFVGVSEFNPKAAQSISTGQPVVDVKEGRSADNPAFFAEAYVPVMIDQRPIAIVGAEVDQTALRDRIYTTFWITAIALCLLIALAFTTPAIAWYRRTREKERADEQIRYLAHHDVMTGLDNRYRLNEKVQRALISLPERGGKLAFHYIDLDRFKDINDTLGHDVGDSLVRAVAERLRATARRKDVVARIGGDEFTIAQLQATDRGEAEALAQRVISAMKAPFVINGHTISVTASIGVAIAPTDAIDMAELMRCADLALYKAKADGRNCARFFNRQLDIDNQARLILERTLRDTVANNSFDLHYQPVYDSLTRKLVGFEALLRLPPLPDGTDVSPSVFIPMAEELGLIGGIARWVLHEACRAATAWPEELTVAVNMSPAQFADGNVCTLVKEALHDSGLAPHRLEIEITEGLLLGDTEAVMKQLAELKEIGVLIVMDDFGTGYSSLSYLWRFHFDKIKIDQSFMAAFEKADHDAETIVKTIVTLGRALHMQVTVEGVESRPQAEFVRGISADQVQGFYYGHPMPAADIAAKLLTEFHRSAAPESTEPEKHEGLQHAG